MIDTDKWYGILFYVAWIEVSAIIMLTGLFVFFRTQSGAFDIPPGNLVMMVGFVSLILAIIGVFDLVCCGGYLQESSRRTE